MPKKTDWQELNSPQNQGQTGAGRRANIAGNTAGNATAGNTLDPNRFQYEVANEIGVTGRVSDQQAGQWDSQTRARKRRGTGGGTSNQ